MRATTSLLVLFLGTACRPVSNAPVDAASPDAVDAPPDAPPPMILTSPMLAEGASFAPDNTCTGANVSPQLLWDRVPAAAQSFAVVLTDLSNNVVHWVIYDIPATERGLPADVEKVFAPSDVPGAHQTASFSGDARGYLGPCPPSRHTYEIVAYALDVAALPGASMTTTRSQALSTILLHDVASAKLTGTYMKP